jgi:hypothetical protein
MANGELPYSIEAFCKEDLERFGVATNVIYKDLYAKSRIEDRKRLHDRLKKSHNKWFTTFTDQLEAAERDKRSEVTISYVSGGANDESTEVGSQGFQYALLNFFYVLLTKKYIYKTSTTTSEEIDFLEGRFVKTTDHIRIYLRK